MVELLRHLPLIGFLLAIETLLALFAWRLARRFGARLHDRDLAFGIADRIAMIHEGRILAVGGPGQIRQSAVPLVQRFLQAEFKEPNLATETTSP